MPRCGLALPPSSASRVWRSCAVVVRARVQNGYWVFQAPVGYRYERVSGHGKLLVRDEPNASALREALEGYASGRFETQVEVKRFLERQPSFPKDLPNGEIRNQRIHDFLTRPVYAGYVEAPNWDVSLRKGHHEGLVSFATFEKIQARLKGTAKAPARKDINADFPLRGFILCDDCSKPLTACWSQGKKEKYPYYLCPAKGCESYRKSIRREVLEGEFEDVLKRMEPVHGLFALVKAMFQDAWDMRLAQASEAKKTLKAQIGKLEKQIDQLLDLIVDANSDSVVSAYEKRIAKLEREKLLAQEQLIKTGSPRHTLEESFEHAMSFLANPWKICSNSEYALKKTVLRLAFAEPLPYCRNQGLRTPNLALPFKVLGEICSQNCEMAHPIGFEPMTSAFGGQRSIRLSYGCRAPAYRAGAGRKQCPSTGSDAVAGTPGGAAQPKSGFSATCHIADTKARHQGNAGPRSMGSDFALPAGYNTRRRHDTFCHPARHHGLPVCRRCRGAVGRSRAA